MNTRHQLSLWIFATITACPIAHGATFLWSTVNPTYGLLEGTATFTVVSDSNSSHCGASSCYDLQIVLKNTSTNPANQSSQALEGIFFDLHGSTGAELNMPTGMLSAAATGGQLFTTGSTIKSGTLGADICGAGQAASSKSPLCATVAKGWENAYRTTGFTVGGTAYTEHYGIGDAGWGLFQGNKVGNPTNGIVPAVGIATSGTNSSITKNYPFVDGTATFILYGLTQQKVTIANVKAAYGTAPEAAVAARTDGLPEPGTLALVPAALVVLVTWQRRRRHE
ncbi:MAG TPA: XDD4 family exosortase-dependent surface protein [Candidatus Sulfopaludibacter sp.]|nr:XDD4 family exosortase-dependent surface protein [Candidatus Sulfopaludibacter sp.]